MKCLQQDCRYIWFGFFFFNVESVLFKFFSKPELWRSEVIRCVCVCSYTKWVWYQPTDSFSSNICTQHCGRSATESGGECSEPWALPGAPVLVLSHSTALACAGHILELPNHPCSLPQIIHIHCHKSSTFTNHPHPHSQNVFDNAFFKKLF